MALLTSHPPKTNGILSQHKLDIGRRGAGFATETLYNQQGKGDSTVCVCLHLHLKPLQNGHLLASSINNTPPSLAGLSIGEQEKKNNPKNNLPTQGNSNGFGFRFPCPVRLDPPLRQTHSEYEETNRSRRVLRNKIGFFCSVLLPRTTHLVWAAGTRAPRCIESALPESPRQVQVKGRASAK